MTTNPGASTLGLNHRNDQIPRDQEEAMLIRHRTFGIVHNMALVIGMNLLDTALTTTGHHLIRDNRVSARKE